MKTKIIKSGSIDTIGLKKVGKGFLIGFAGYALTFLGELTNIADFGEYQAVVAVLLATGVNFGYKYLSEYKA